MVQQTPVGLTHIASLGAYPTQVTTVATIVPDKTLGLQLADHAVGLGPLVVGRAVDMAHLVGTTIPAIATIGTVEPHLEDITIVGQQFAQLVAEIGDVGRTPVFGMVSVPWREVDGKGEALLATGLCQLAHHVALALFPGGVLHRVVGIRGRPHAEAAVVLGGEDDATHACLFADTSPLATVEVGGIEQLRVFIAEAPFLIGIRVQRVMDEGIHLHILPSQLVCRGHRPTRLLCTKRHRPRTEKNG